MEVGTRPGVPGAAGLCGRPGHPWVATNCREGNRGRGANYRGHRTDGIDSATLQVANTVRALDHTRQGADRGRPVNPRIQQRAVQRRSQGDS